MKRTGSKIKMLRVRRLVTKNKGRKKGRTEADEKESYFCLLYRSFTNKNSNPTKLC